MLEIMKGFALKPVLLWILAFFFINFLSILNPKSSLAATCAISPTTITKGTYFTVTASGLTANSAYNLLFNGSTIYLTTNTTDGGGSLNTRGFIPVNHPISPGTYQAKLWRNNLEQCAIGQIIVQNPVSAEKYRCDKTSKSCSLCTAGNDCTFTALTDCQSYCTSLPGGPGYKPEYCLGSYGIQTAIGCIPTTASGFAWFFLKYLLGIAGLIAFFLIILAAFQILTSGGNPEKLEGGKQLLTAALVGLFFIIFSVVILQFIGINILGGLPGFPKVQEGGSWYPGEP